MITLFSVIDINNLEDSLFKFSVINIEVSKNIKTALEFASSNGFEYIELHSAWGKNIETLSKGEILKLKQLIISYGLKVSCISSTIFLRCFLDDRNLVAPEIKGFDSISGNYDDHIKYLINAILAAEMLDAPIVRVFGFQKEPLINIQLLNKVVEKFEKPSKLAKEAGLILALENCPHTSFGKVDDAVKLIELIDSSSVRLLWDPANSLAAGAMAGYQNISSLLPFLAIIHVKDFILNSEGKRIYVPAGEGELKWDGIIQHLKNTNFSGFLSFEPHFRGKDGSKASAILESKSSMQKIFQENDIRNFENY